MNNSEYSVLDAFRNVINSKDICEIVSRTELLHECRLMNLDLAASYIDTTRRQLIVCDFLENTGIPGKYRILKRIPRDLTVGGLKRMTEYMYDSHRDIYINNSKTLTEKFIHLQNDIDNN